MCNLLISAQEDAWKKGYYEMVASRFLEYTIPRISEIFQPLSSNMDNLMRLPCLFAYEGTEKPYRFGRITEIVDRGSLVYIKYELDKDVQPIPFEKIKHLSNLLDIRDWEINRTHWAVKDGNLIDIDVLSRTWTHFA